MLYELRIYTVVSGRRKDIEDLFRDTNLPNFKKYGISVEGVWYSAKPEEDVLFYLLKFKDEADQKAKWDAFYAEPSWQVDIAAWQKRGDVLSDHKGYNIEMVPFYSEDSKLY